MRILIERHLKAGKQGEPIHLLRELRTAAIHQTGYICGETLSSLEDPSNHLGAKHLAKSHGLEEMGGVSITNQAGRTN